ncbi:hypothetical protein WH47_00812 [Habropoda laboriosa]|uniref:Uncharacterized protein n=1 Tax=Habropoda laboriosa TaxID=597456 RepID=A0A0L7QK20_9HYME|nr:hypothetical protein WH47_00812 [Habropoda laboriosa]
MPADYFTDTTGTNEDPSELVNQLRAHMRNLRPTKGTRHGAKRSFVFKDLSTTTHVFIRADTVRGPLQNPYEGPFPVISRAEKTYVIQIRGKNVTVSLDRLKPANVFEKDDESHPPEKRTIARTYRTRKRDRKHTDPHADTCTDAYR